MSDEEIVKLYFAGNDSASTETDRKYGAMCRTVAYNILRDEQDAKECANDVLVCIWQHIPPLVPRNFQGYVYKTARNSALNRLKLDKTRNKRLETVAFAELEDVLPDNRVASDAEEGEITRVVNEFLKACTPIARKMFVRRYWYNDSVKQIAADFGFTYGKVKSTLHRARKKLREYLNQEGVMI